MEKTEEEYWAVEERLFSTDDALTEANKIYLDLITQADLSANGPAPLGSLTADKQNLENARTNYKNAKAKFTSASEKRDNAKINLIVAKNYLESIINKVGAK